MTRVAVIGVGHFGREHARIYSAMERVRLAAVCDLDESRGRSLASQFGVPFVSDFREVVGEVDAVSLAVPTVDHSWLACELLEAGIDVLVEKPMARTLEEADLMIAAAAKTRRVLQIGHLERFNPAVKAVRSIVTTPRFFEAHRLSVFSPRSLDIDVVMDLMIHDLDVVASLTRSDVAEIRAAGIPILTSRIDIANARIEFNDGCVANLTASRVSGERVRKLRFFQPHEYVSIDYSAQEANVVTVENDPSTAASQSGGSWPKLNARTLPVDHEEPLLTELRSFIGASRGGPVEVSGTEGRRALALALAVTEKIHEHAQRAGVRLG